MKKFEKLGRSISKTEQKKIIGGFFQFDCTGLGTYFYSGPDFCCIMDCTSIEDNKCYCECVAGTKVTAPCGYA